jgi:hypothetical protein
VGLEIGQRHKTQAGGRECRCKQNTKTQAGGRELIKQNTGHSHDSSSNDFFYRVFGRLVTRGVQKHDKNLKKKNPSGLITKNVCFFPSVFFPPPSVVLLDFFIAFLGVS